MKVSRVGEMRAMDRMAIEQFGISAELLMENAGHAAYFVLRNEFRFLNKRFLIFCGMGNNGGDGFVLARKINANGGVLGKKIKIVWRDFDHQSVQAVYAVRFNPPTKVNADKYKLDYFQILSSIMGSKAVRTRAEWNIARKAAGLPTNLEPFPGEVSLR